MSLIPTLTPINLEGNLWKKSRQFLDVVCECGTVYSVFKDHLKKDVKSLKKTKRRILNLKKCLKKKMILINELRRSNWFVQSFKDLEAEERHYEDDKYDYKKLLKKYKLDKGTLYYIRCPFCNKKKQIRIYKDD